MAWGPGALAADATDAALNAAGLEQLIEATSDAGFDPATFARRLMSGDVELDAGMMKRLLMRLTASAAREAKSLAAGIAAPIALSALLRLLFGSRSAALGAPRLLCALCCAAVLARYYGATHAAAVQLAVRLSKATEAMSPALAVLLAVGGSTAGAAIASPMAALCAGFISDVLGGPGLRLCALAAALAAVGGLSEQFRLDHLFALTRSAQRWLLGLSMLAFAAILSARGAMAISKDSAALQAARSAIEGMVPIIGGELSDAAGALAGSAGIARSAVGITGVAAIAFVCGRPILRLAAAALALKAIAAVAEPAAEGPLPRMIGRFGEAVEMLFATCVACAALAVLLAGSCLAYVLK